MLLVLLISEMTPYKFLLPGNLSDCTLCYHFTVKPFSDNGYLLPWDPKTGSFLLVKWSRQHKPLFDTMPIRLFSYEEGKKRNHFEFKYDCYYC